MASMSLPIVMSWRNLDSVAEAVSKSSVKIQASVSIRSSSTSQFAEDTYTPSSESAQNTESSLAAESSGAGAGQSHFKLRDDFVLKGHGFSRAEERS